MLLRRRHLTNSMFHILFQELERSNRRIYFQVQISGTMLKVKSKSIAKGSMLASKIVEYSLILSAACNETFIPIKK